MNDESESNPKTLWLVGHPACTLDPTSLGPSGEGNRWVEEMSVVVHGGEGLDGTLAVAALAQLLLDPDARTCRGFASLVEREFVRGGHPFQSRCAHAAYAKGKETGPREAPTFALFLHTVAAVPTPACLWPFCGSRQTEQVMHQYATSFEFRDDFLLLLLVPPTSSWSTFGEPVQLRGPRIRLGVRDVPGEL